MAARSEAVYPVSWRSGRVSRWLVTVDHKRIGIMYICTSLVFFALGGFLALLIRTQLLTPDESFLTKNSYNEVVTIHGTTMIFLVIVPILAGFGNYLVPLMVGARDMAFPRLNALSYWLFPYPNGAVSIDRMVAPAGEVVHEDVVGYDYDVNHSWWVPDLGGKYDAIPGKTNHTWFEAPVGSYIARCAELCGIQHALMSAVVDVVPRAQYEQFVSQRLANASSATLGREEWFGVCQKCHRLDHKYIGPALGGNSLLGDRKGIETLLRNGQGAMPAVGKNWQGSQIDALIAWTKQYAKGGSQ